MKTLDEAREEFFEAAKGQGGRCPCCDRFGKIYKRKLHSSMAAVLILLYRNQHLGYVHVHTLINASISPAVAAAIRGDFAKLRYWDLIQEGFDIRDGDKKHNGTWRITETGVAFATGKIKVYEKIWLYNTQFLGVAGDKQIDIFDALGNRFSYRELMS